MTDRSVRNNEKVVLMNDNILLRNREVFFNSLAQSCKILLESFTIMVSNAISLLKPLSRLKTCFNLLSEAFSPGLGEGGCYLKL